jgi:hypothetical protein
LDAAAADTNAAAATADDDNDVVKQIYLVDLVQNHYSTSLQYSDLQHVRDSFEDRLANFHCLGKTIYTSTLDCKIFFLDISYNFLPWF